MEKKSYFECFNCSAKNENAEQICDHIVKKHPKLQIFRCCLIKNNMQCRKEFSNLFTMKMHMKTCEIHWNNNQGTDV